MDSTDLDRHIILGSLDIRFNAISISWSVFCTAHPCPQIAYLSFLAAANVFVRYFPIWYMVSWAHMSQPHKQHLDRLRRFCAVQTCAMHCITTNGKILKVTWPQPRPFRGWYVVLLVTLDTDYLCKKFDDSSFSYSWGMFRALKFKVDRVTWSRPSQGEFAVCRLGPATINRHTKLEVSTECQMLAYSSWFSVWRSKRRSRWSECDLVCLRSASWELLTTSPTHWDLNTDRSTHTQLQKHTCMNTERQTWVNGKNHIRWGPDPSREGALLRKHVPAHCNVPTHDCIQHCSPAAAGECACPVHAVDKRIFSREGWQDGEDTWMLVQTLSINFPWKGTSQNPSRNS